MDINWIIAQLTPMLVRYGVYGVGIMLLTLGLSDEQVAGLNGEITAAVVGKGSRSRARDRRQAARVRTREDRDAAGHERHLRPGQGRLTHPRMQG